MESMTQYLGKFKKAQGRFAASSEPYGVRLTTHRQSKSNIKRHSTERRFALRIGRGVMESAGFMLGDRVDISIEGATGEVLIYRITGDVGYKLTHGGLPKSKLRGRRVSGTFSTIYGDFHPIQIDEGQTLTIQEEDVRVSKRGIAFYLDKKNINKAFLNGHSQ